MIVVPRRPLWQRAINRPLHRFGIKPFPIQFEFSLPEARSDSHTLFNAVYAANYWESEESKSGGGSTLEATAQYVPQLTKAIRDFAIGSMFDAPCGDLNWMPQVIDRTGIRYLGGDIADDAVRIAGQRRPDLETARFDLCSDDFPDADLWHCRDTFFHLSFADISRALAMAKASNIGLAAVTTHRALWLKNVDVRTGGFRLLDLERPPFNFPRPLRYLRDYRWGEFPRYVAIWRMADIPLDG